MGQSFSDPSEPDELPDQSPSSSQLAEDVDADLAAESDLEVESAGKASKPMRAAIQTFVFLLLVAVVLNWPYQYSATSSNAVGSSSTPVDFDLLPADPPRLGGWPFRFWISYAASDVQPSVRVFSTTALLYDLGLALLPIVIIALYFYRRTRRTVAGRLKGKRVTIADLLAITLVLAAPLALWQRLDATNKTEGEFVRRVTASGGSVSMSAWTPSLIRNHLPSVLVDKLKRVHGVRLENPGDELLSEVIDRRNLQALRIGGSSYDLRILDRIAASPFLVDVRIAGRVIDTATLQWIASQPRLRTLNLMRTNVTSRSLKLLDSVAGLERLNLIHTDVKLSELADPAWSQSIRQLWLPHPVAGESDSLAIDGWPKLTKLQINELDTYTNSSVMKVVLTDLPELTELGLDIFQKYDLTLRNLPRLQKVNDLDFEWQSRIPRGGVTPGVKWFSRFTAQNLPELKGLLNFFAVDLEEIHVEGVPKVETLGPAAFHRANQRTTPYVRQLSKEVATALINGIGNSDGPPCVDLDAVPLAGVDLSPLMKNKKLNHIMLSQSQTSLKEWQGLAGMDWLKRLEVKGCPIDAEAFQWILEHFPNLEHLAISPSTDFFYSAAPFALEIVDRPNLRVLDLGDMPTQFFRKARVVNSPNVSIDLKLGFVEELEVSGSPGVKGLAVDGPLPPKTKLADLGNLDYFAVGGPTVTDETLKSIADCKNLSTLTLAYPEVTVEGMKALPVKLLRRLSVPGSALDDTVVEAWPELRHLERLDARDTAITGAALKKLLSGGRVRRVLLDRTNITLSDLNILTKQAGLIELSLAGIGVDAGLMKSILAPGKLQRLDLSDTKVDAKVLDELSGADPTLQHITLRNCEFDSAELFNLAKRNKRILFDITGSNVTANVHAAILSSDRIVEASELDQRIAIERMQSSFTTNFSFVEPELQALIHVENFSPRALQNYRNPTLITPLTPPPRRGLGQWLTDMFTTQTPATDPDSVAEPDPVDIDRALYDKTENGEGEQP